MARLLGILMVALLFLVATRAEAGVSKRVKFQPGRYGATIRGAVIRGERDRWYLGASKGQVMTVGVKSLENNASFVILRASNEQPVSGYDIKSWRGRLPAAGDYIIEVGPTRGNATYTLTVSIE